MRTSRRICRSVDFVLIFVVQECRNTQIRSLSIGRDGKIWVVSKLASAFSESAAAQNRMNYFPLEIFLQVCQKFFVRYPDEYFRNTATARERYKLSSRYSRNGSWSNHLLERSQLDFNKKSPAVNGWTRCV